MEPRDDVAWILFEVEHLKNQSNLDEALKKLEDGLVKHSQDYRLYEEIADIYLYKGDLEKAEKAVDFALVQNSTSATGNYLKGFILLSSGQYLQAIEYLEMSNSILPNNSEVIRNLGWAYVTGTQNKEKGVFILKRALILSPHDPLIKEDYAMALISMGNISEGNAILKELGKKPIYI